MNLEGFRDTADTTVKNILKTTEADGALIIVVKDGQGIVAGSSTPVGTLSLIEVSGDYIEKAKSKLMEDLLQGLDEPMEAETN